MVIDGRIAYTGGFNIADEYINLRSRFGHWKDTGLRLVGPVAQTLSLPALRVRSPPPGLPLPPGD